MTWVEDQDQEQHYFRLNVWMMMVARDLMWRRGMLDLEASPPDESRGKIPSYKLSSNDGWHVTPEEIEGSLKAYEDYLRADPEADREVRLESEPMTTEWEGLFKAFAEALKGSEFLLVEEGQEIEWWPEWVAWLSQATEHGGFNVY